MLLCTGSGGKMFSWFLLNIIITIVCVRVCVYITRRSSPFLTHHTVPFKFFISFYCGDTRSPNVSREQRIALLDEHSHADVFPIIWPAVILWCCTTGWKLLKSKVLGEGAGFPGIIFAI